MSSTSPSSSPITQGKRYSANAPLGWPALDATFEAHAHADASSSAEKETSEGGLHAWLTVGGSALVYFATFGIINSFGFFQAYYERTLLEGTPASTIAFVGTLQVTLMNVLAAPVGALFDCYGLRLLYIFSGISCAGALAGLSFIQTGSLWQIFLVQGVLVGVANAFGSQPALVVVGQHFVRRRALVMGIVAAAGSVGGVCFPVIFARLAGLEKVEYAWSLRVVAGIVMLCYTMAVFVSRANLPKQCLSSMSKLLDFKGFLDLRYSVLAVGAFLAMLGQFIPFYYINTYTQAVHPTSPSKDYLLPLMNASSFVGRILGGLAADRIGPTNTLYPMTILSGLLCLDLWVVTSSLPALIVFVSLYGFCSGVFIAVLPVVVAQMTPDERLGGRIGAFYSLCAIAQLVGSPMGGALIQKTEGREVGGGGSDRAMEFYWLKWFAGFTLFAGGIVIFACRLVHDVSIRARY